MKTALVHDWLTSYGGAEQVLQEIYALFPGDVFTLSAKKSIATQYGIPFDAVHTSFIEQLPFNRRLFKQYLPLFPLAIEQFDLSEYDLILSSSHCVAKGVLTHHAQTHICYCHSPMRYAWDLYHSYIQKARLVRGIKGWIAQLLLHRLRLWDSSSTFRVDHFIANSEFIAKRIKKTYGREATVIYPPVETDRFSFVATKEDYYVTASRLVPYKNIDLIVEAFRFLPQKKLIVLGDGEMLPALKRNAPPNVEFLGFVTNEVMEKYIQHARAFLFAAVEDFGILPVEAQSCGTPVIALGQGGTKETVLHEITGIHFHKQTVDSLIEAISYFETRTFDAEQIAQHASFFSKERFHAEFSAFVSQCTESSVQYTI